MKPEPSLALRVSAVLLALVPLWWLLGVDVILFSAVALWLWLRAHPPLSWDLLSLSTLALVAVFAARALAALYGGAEPERVVAALYNAVLLLTGLSFYLHVVAELQLSEAPAWALAQRVFAPAPALLGITTALSGAVWILTRAKGDPLLAAPTALGLLHPAPLPGILALSQTATFAAVDWGTGSALPRLSVYGPYANATAIIVCVIGCFAFLDFALRPRGGRRTAWVAGLSVLGILLFTASRVALLGVFGGYAAAALLFGSPARKAAIALALAVCALALMALPQATGSLADFRAGSTSLREDNYAIALHLVAEKAPVFGLGVKPLDPEVQAIPIGSHSTVVSSLIKGGMIAALAVFLAFFVAPATLWARIVLALRRAPPPTGRARRYFAILFQTQVMLWLWLLVEDIDASASSIFVVFLYLAATKGSYLALRQGSHAAQPALVSPAATPAAAGAR